MMACNKLILFLVFISCVLGGSSQSLSTLRNYFNDADYDLSQEDYSNAYNKFYKIYIVDSLNPNINYQLGLCMINLPDKKKKAVKHLKIAVSEITSNYQNGTYDERKAPLRSFYEYAKALMLVNDFSQAEEVLISYKKKIDERDKYHLADIDRKLESCRYAKILMKRPVKVTYTNLDNLNGSFSDFNPVVSSDDAVMLFTREQVSGKSDGEKRLFSSYKTDGKWGDPVNITELFSSSGYLSTLAISSDAKIAMFNDDDENKNSIYQAINIKKKWQAAKKLNRKVNSGYAQHSAYITKNGKLIYFSSNRKDGFGGYDIYKIEYKDDEWGEPINLGPGINTSFDEFCPVLLEDGKTMFFSSEGHTSMGGLDVFYSRADQYGDWGEPINMGFPFNSSDDNVNFWPVGDGYSGYISLFGEDSKGEKDIYHVKIDQPEQLLTHELILSEEKALSDTLHKNDISASGVAVKDSSTTLNANNTSASNTDTTNLMTILIKVTKNPLESAYLKDIEGVRAYRGADGYIRYYFGQYLSYDDASADFEKIMKIGFYSAQLKNIKEDTLYNYATSDYVVLSDTTATDYNPALSEKGSMENTSSGNSSNQNNIVSYNPKLNNNKESKGSYNPNLTSEDNKKNKIDNTEKDSANKGNVKQNETKSSDEVADNKINREKKASTDNVNNHENSSKNEDNKKSDLKSLDEKTKITSEQKLDNKSETSASDDKLNTAVATSYPLNDDLNSKLINAEGDIFIVQISTVNVKGNLAYFKNLSDVTEHQCKDGKYRYTSGVFQTKEEALRALETLRTLGYKDAYVANFKFFRNNLFNGNPKDFVKTYSLKEEVEKAKEEEEKLYSVQIGSSIKFAEAAFLNVEGVMAKKTRNGFYKYYYGKLKGYQAAKAELEKARNGGYKDAFIIKYVEGESLVTAAEKAKDDADEDENTNASTVIEPSKTYTIQVSSAKKRSETKYFKGLEVKEIEGKNGFYIYISGEFNSIASAKAELKNIRKLGFKDAFINKLERY